MPSGSTRTTSRQFASASDAFKRMSVMVDDLLESCPRRTAELRRTRARRWSPRSVAPLPINLNNLDERR